MRKDVSGFTVRLDDDTIARRTSSGEWANKSVLDRVLALVQQDGGRRLFVETGLSLSRQQAVQMAVALAAALSRLGLVRGDVVSYQLPNWPEVAILDLAAAWLGLVINPLVPIYREAEIGYMMQDCRAKAVLIPSTFRRHEYAAMYAKIRVSLPELQHVILVRGAQGEAESHGMLSFEEMLVDIDQHHVPRVAVDPNDVKFILYTSGTTGRPKGVIHSHNTIEAAARACAANWRLGPDDTIIMPSTLTHSTGYLYGLVLPCFIGMTVIYMPVWDAAEAVAVIEANDVRFTVCATAFLREITAVCHKRQRGLQSMRYFACGGAPVPPETIFAAYEALGGCMPARIYGSTEAFTVTLGPTDPADLKRAATTDGFIVNSEVKIVDESGASVGIGVDGELVTQGPQLFLGYSDPADNMVAFDDEGYFRTGDLAVVDEANWLTITGRKKDLIIRGGENISAKEVEDVLVQHTAIAEAAVVSVPHARLGETCCAYLRLTPEAEASGTPPTLQSLATFLQGAGLAIQKCPEHIVIVEDFPRTSVGKIKKNVLRDEIRQVLSRPSPD